MAVAYDPNDPEDPLTGVPKSYTDTTTSKRAILDQQLGGDASGASFLPGEPGMGAPGSAAPASAGSNVNFRDLSQYGYDVDLNPAASALGMTRDQLAEQRDAYWKPQLDAFKSQNGNRVAEDDKTAISQLLGQTALKNVDAGVPGAATTAADGGGGGVSAFTQGLRDILMQQLGDASKPVSVDDPGVRDVLAGGRLGLQRSAERQQRQNAERLAMDGLSNSGAADTGRMGIEQQRGEAEAQMTGNVLSGELNQRRQQLQGLLSLALQSGDNESARAIQMELAKMNQSMGQDQLAYNYAALNQNANLAALNAILGGAGL